jgi:hypothetical protein
MPTLSRRRQSSSYTLPSYKPKERKSFTAKYFRLCYFKSFCLIFIKLYVLSYFARISAIPLLVFQSFAEYEQEPPDVGELREELAT